ncbi:MAG: hypothetical protein E7679_07300 [Ruminococcaceae bacterium]|nr:hypothetical protein [Oscillospiraceae bacterium]
MKKLYLYIILILFEITIGLSYAFILWDLLSIEIYLIFAFFVPFLLFVIFSKNDEGKITAKTLKILILSLLLALSSFMPLITINAITAEFVAEHEVVVENIGGRGGGWASFTSHDGLLEYVDLHDYRIILTDEDEYVTIGDTIRVKEYKGIFDISYYVFVEEVY